MSTPKYVNGRTQLEPNATRLGNINDAILADEAITKRQFNVGSDTTGNTTTSGNNTHTGTETFTNATGVTTDNITANSATFIKANRALVQGHTTAAANATATLTAAQVATGYITSTSAAPTTLTLPTGTLLGAALGATQGTIHDLFIDNTAGASTVTIAVAVNGIISAAATAGAGAGAGLLTVPSGVTGQGCFRLMFSSATAYTFSRIA
mgnify:CR=1 FL=1